MSFFVEIRDCNFIGKSKKSKVVHEPGRADACENEIHLRKERRANGGCLGYPEAKKDVVSCEKSRGSANRT